MSKNSDKGRKGELAATAVFSNIGVHEKNIEVVRANTTNTPENGVDLALTCPHNLSQKLDEIVKNDNSDMALSNAKIDVRVQIKNYTKPINKTVMQGFVDDNAKNINFAEHWGVGGTRLTKGAQDVLDKANETAVTKWYTALELTKIQSKYPEIPFSEINNDDE
jgi:hypothetical protein